MQRSNRITSTSNKTPSPVSFSLRVIWGIILIPILILLFGWIAIAMMADRFNQLDQQVVDWLRQAASPTLTQLVTWITHLATSYVIITVAIVAALWFAFVLRLKVHAMILLATIGGSYLLNETLKTLLMRTRPEWEHWVHATGYSFPSGHTMAAVSFYGMLTYLLYRIVCAKGIPAWYIPLIGGVLIIAIGMSRVYLGVHYFTDVLAGFLAGGVWLLICMYALSWLCHKYRI